MSSVHAHEFINLIGQQTEPKAIAQLSQLATEAFGADARFHTCHSEDQTADQILAFLQKMDKIVVDGEGFVLNRGNVCNH
ncbi:YecH family metal-binding protein [Ferrimonas lipolytica]|uniref:YecH family protein n=1 Tax=Ferrimonas lipolytica TaxID=2724191 RepID=A0A6H1UFL7_9GAMM|nr:YecH family metal-binding protein [Ferrimonas lipolytica]QIZ77006.1 YecH family protein [Ferrimonas lipolytica]